MKATQKYIKQRLASGDFRISTHAAERMIERVIFEDDIRTCGRKAKKISFQEDKQTWKVEGLDLDNQPLTVICALKLAVLIVTIY